MDWHWHKDTKDFPLEPHNLTLTSHQPDNSPCFSPLQSTQPKNPSSWQKFIFLLLRPSTLFRLQNFFFILLTLKQTSLHHKLPFSILKKLMIPSQLTILPSTKTNWTSLSTTTTRYATFSPFFYHLQSAISTTTSFT